MVLLSPLRNNPSKSCRLSVAFPKTSRSWEHIEKKDKIWFFSVSEADKILKISQLFAMQENGYGMIKCQSSSCFTPSTKRENYEDCCDKKHYLPVSSHLRMLLW
jgi:hypothetical protein